MSEFKLLINGQLVSGDSEIDVINPATEEVFSSCPVASKIQLDEAVKAAERAYVDWSRTPVKERRASLIRVARIVESNSLQLGEILTTEQGKPLNQAIAEAKRFAHFTETFAEMSLPVEIIEDSSKRKVEIHRCSLGVVAAIIPWNFPLLLLGFKFAPALLAGNTLIIKPAPTTPLSTLKLGELVRDALPPGVINIISDDNTLGDEISSHSGIRKISFTGSAVTGMKVLSNAAKTLKRVTLELGGNDAALVLNDVDPKEVAPKLFQAAFGNTGQVCISIKRLYVHEKIFDAVCDQLVIIAESLKIGDGAEPDVEMGPLQNRAQYEKVLEIIKEAKEYGNVIAGGESLNRKGYFIEPTLVRDVLEGTRLVDEEQFGPVLPIIKYSDPNLAIVEINKSNYGLGGSVWSQDIERAHSLAMQMESGTVWINKHPEIDPMIPFGGAKESGIGIELGREGLDEFTQRKTINIAR